MIVGLVLKSNLYNIGMKSKVIIVVKSNLIIIVIVMGFYIFFLFRYSGISFKVVVNVVSKIGWNCC